MIPRSITFLSEAEGLSVDAGASCPRRGDVEVFWLAPAEELVERQARLAGR